MKGWQHVAVVARQYMGCGGKPSGLLVESLNGLLVKIGD